MDDVIIEAGGARIVLRPLTNRGVVRQLRIIDALDAVHPGLFKDKSDPDNRMAWGFATLVSRHRESSGLNFPIPAVENGAADAEIVAAYEQYMEDTNVELGVALLRVGQGLSAKDEPGDVPSVEPVDPNVESGARKGGKGSKADSAAPPAATSV
jgi:hypothetical protein